MATQFVGGEVGERGRHAADIDGIDPGGADAVHQRPGQFGAGQAAVAADGDGRLAPFDGQRAQGMADLANHVGSQRFIDNAPNVVGLERFRRVVGSWWSLWRFVKEEV